MTVFSRSWCINGETGRYCHMQLWNAGSADLEFIAAGASIPAASMVALLTADTALDHSLTDAGAGSDRGISGANAPSVHGVLKYRVDSSLWNGGQICNRIGQANTYVPFTEMAGMIIPPNRGIFIRTPTLGMTFFGTFVWKE